MYLVVEHHWDLLVVLGVTGKLLSAVVAGLVRAVIPCSARTALLLQTMSMPKQHIASSIYILPACLWHLDLGCMALKQIGRGKLPR